MSRVVIVECPCGWSRSIHRSAKSDAPAFVRAVLAHEHYGPIRRAAAVAARAVDRWCAEVVFDQDPDVARDICRMALTEIVAEALDRLTETGGQT